MSKNIHLERKRCQGGWQGDMDYEKLLLLEETADVINNVLSLVASQRSLPGCCSLPTATSLQALSSLLFPLLLAPLWH